ncbi:MAG: thioesterase family protein [Candidatus Zixiibacteriota bacterium]
MFTHHTTVQLHQTDAAGILFFGRFFFLAHDAYQAYIESKGLGFAKILDQGLFLLPIVHAEADYKAPLRVGDKVTVRLRAETIGTTSFILAYELTKEDGAMAGTVKTVHVWVDRKTFEKQPLPEWVKGALGKIA